MNHGQIWRLAAKDSCAELVLELMKRLCLEEDLAHNPRVSPTAPPSQRAGNAQPDRPENSP